MYLPLEKISHPVTLSIRFSTNNYLELSTFSCKARCFYFEPFSLRNNALNNEYFPRSALQIQLRLLCDKVLRKVGV